MVIYSFKSDYLLVCTLSTETQRLPLNRCPDCLHAELFQFTVFPMTVSHIYRDYTVYDNGLSVFEVEKYSMTPLGCRQPLWWQTLSPLVLTHEHPLTRPCLAPTRRTHTMF